MVPLKYAPFVTTDDSCADNSEGGDGKTFARAAAYLLVRPCHSYLVHGPQLALKAFGGPLRNLSHSSVAVAVTRFPERLIGTSIASLRGREAGGCTPGAFQSVETDGVSTPGRPSSSLYWVQTTMRCMFF